MLLLEKRGHRRELVVAPVLTSTDKALGSPARAFAVGERLLQRERPAFWKAEDRKGGVHLEQALVSNESAVSERAERTWEMMHVQRELLLRSQEPLQQQRCNPLPLPVLHWEPGGAGCWGWPHTRVKMLP